MRGRLYMRLPAYPPSGNTPAYAGKTSDINTASGPEGKHPRVCGEDSATISAPLLTRETPPRMRGRRYIVGTAQAGRGNTPAYAGKTILSRLCNLQSEKHPRVCGEDAMTKDFTCPAAETPPRMRGRPCSCPGILISPGNTPAYAGKTSGV